MKRETRIRWPSLRFYDYGWVNVIIKTFILVLEAAVRCKAVTDEDAEEVIRPQRTRHGWGVTSDTMPEHLPYRSHYSIHSPFPFPLHPSLGITQIKPPIHQTMSQQQPQRHGADQSRDDQLEAIKTGDVSNVNDEPASYLIEPQDVSADPTTPSTLIDPGLITIGEALEVAALSAADKPIDHSDVAAIKAAEMRATGSSEILPGGITSEAQSAAIRNSQTDRLEDQATLSDVLADASSMLPKDKAVTREDADRVVAAELTNNPDMTITLGGVGAAMAVAARRNQNTTI
ncbi:hypothetical protein V6N13_146872 [Hibiscus sabdariffa]